MKVLLNKSYGGNLYNSSQMIELKNKLAIQYWEDFVIDERVIKFIEEKIPLIECQDDEEEGKTYAISCKIMSTEYPCRIRIQEVDTTRPWMITEYDDFEEVTYLKLIANNRYVDTE